jgi:hypothetical protein
MVKMKKLYVSPQLEITPVDIENLMLTASPGEGGEETNPNPAKRNDMMYFDTESDQQKDEKSDMSQGGMWE